jgi:aminoglycoside phosphotransferase (APT) family kinase protein
VPRTLAATQVVRVIRHELALLREQRAGAGAEQLLRIADQLLERASLDDDLPSRRTGATPRDGHALVRRELGDTGPVVGEEGEQETSTSFESALPPSLTEAEILDAFCRAAPGMRASSVTDVRRISGGFSKETIRAVVVDKAGGTTDVVIRKVAPGRRADGLRLEYDVVSYVARSEVPAPRPLWFQEDCSGTPAFAATGLPGGLLGDVWGWAERPASSAVRDLGHAMGTLHALDTSQLDSLPLSPLSSHQDHVVAIAERREVLEGIWPEDDAFRPVFERVLVWLEENAPEDTSTQALVHGDFGLHNILFLDGHLTGLLDWERAHLGNPAEDLAYLKPALDQVGAWETFLASYQEAGGPPLSTHDLAYFSVWQDLWRAVSSFRIRAKFLAEPAQLSDAVSGLLLTPRFLARAAHGVLERAPNHDDWSVSAC